MIYSFTLVLIKANPPPPCLCLYSCDHYVELTSGSLKSQYEGDMQSFCSSRQFASYMASSPYLEDSVYLYQYGALTSYDPVNLRGLFDAFTNTDGDSWATFGGDLVML